MTCRLKCPPFVVDSVTRRGGDDRSRAGLFRARGAYTARARLRFEELMKSSHPSVVVRRTRLVLRVSFFALSSFLFRQADAASTTTWRGSGPEFNLATNWTTGTPVDVANFGTTGQSTVRFSSATTSFNTM